MTFRIITIFQNNAVIHLGTSKLKFQITRYRKKILLSFNPFTSLCRDQAPKIRGEISHAKSASTREAACSDIDTNQPWPWSLKKEAEQQQEGARLNAERINTQLSTLCLAALEVLSFLSFDRLLGPPLKAAAARWQFTCAFEEIMSWRGRTVRQLIKMAKI